MVIRFNAHEAHTHRVVRTYQHSCGRHRREETPRNCGVL
jgi:hypothetical protein